MIFIRAFIDAPLLSNRIRVCCALIRPKRKRQIVIWRLVEWDHVMVSERMPPLCKGGRGDWAVSTEQWYNPMRKSTMSLYEFALDFMILNFLPHNPSAPVRTLGHLISGPRAAWRRLASETRLRALPLHKGGHVLRNRNMVPFNGTFRFISLPYSGAKETVTSVVNIFRRK